MKFSDFPGNERVVNYFKTAIDRNHLGHAYLFSGATGPEKKDLAVMICKRLLCREPTDDGPCAQCAACHKFDSGNHPDFHGYSPDGLYFKIDQVRQIIHEASLKPVESVWKTFVLEDVDMLRDEGANALLKVLEEPPGATIFFLLTQTPEVLLPTIRSRCQHFSIHPSPSREEATREEQTELRERLIGVLEATLQPRSYFLLLEAIKAVSVERSEMGLRLLLLEELVRDLVFLRKSPETKLIHEDLRSRLAPLALKASRSDLDRLYEDLLQTREAVLKINANVGLALQALFLPARLERET